MRKASEKEAIFNREIGKRLYSSRKGAGIKQAEVAELLGSSVNHVSEIERGVARITTFETCSYSDLTNVDIAKLTGRPPQKSEILQGIDEELIQQLLELSPEEQIYFYKQVVAYKQLKREQAKREEEK